ncbi:MAG: hypothetical protein LUF27_06665 [Lachnospiraceae bacterium]|nr:hypothetical protein [Lachnospiraceae bacterium]
MLDKKQSITPKINYGSHVIYVNAEVDDGSEMAEMMKYFKTADPDDMSQGALSKRIQFLKREDIKSCVKQLNN